MFSQGPPSRARVVGAYFFEHLASEPPMRHKLSHSYFNAFKQNIEHILLPTFFSTPTAL